MCAVVGASPPATDGITCFMVSSMLHVRRKNLHQLLVVDKLNLHLELKLFTLYLKSASTTLDVSYPTHIARYSHSEAQLVDLITHAALASQRGRGVPNNVSSGDGKRRRVGCYSARDRSPLKGIEERSRDDPSFSRFHSRRAWFLQVR